MSAREILAYAITHAPRGVKGGPYEAIGGDMGDTCASLRGALRWPLDNPVNTAEEVLEEAREFLAEEIAPKVPHARVIRIVRKARPSEASATLETARRRLAAVAESMTEHAYQEMASALEVDACRVGPREASAVEVLRALLPMIGDPTTCDNPGCLGCLAYANARRVLAAAGPDPSEVVRAAMDGATASNEELVTVYRRAAEPLGDEHGVPLFDLMRRCQARGIRAVAARVRQERCLVAHAVAANVDIRVCEDDGGGFMVGVHESGCDEELERAVLSSDVPATLARLLGEVSR